MKRVSLKSKSINKELEHFGLVLSKKDKVELISSEHKYIVVNGVVSFFYRDETPLPTLQYLQKNEVLKKVIVDMGAIKFVVNGADIMRPGITAMDPEIEQDEYVVVVDETHGKPLAVGRMLFNGAKAEACTQGKIITNIHYVGDEIWSFKP